MTEENHESFQALAEEFHKVAQGHSITAVFNAMGMMLGDRFDRPEELRMLSMTIGDIAIMHMTRRAIIEALEKQQAKAVAEAANATKQ